MREQRNISPLVYVTLVISIIAIVMSGFALKGIADISARLGSADASSAANGTDDSTANDSTATTGTDGGVADSSTAVCPASGTEIDVDDWHVKLVSLDSSYTDYSGKPVAVLTYELTNNTGTTNYAPSYAQFKAFQYGQSLDSGYPKPEPDNFLYLGELQTGYSVTATCAFKLKDTASPVDVEFYGDGLDACLVHEFAL